MLMRAVASEEGDRVTTLELFFDLAFVFVFTQLSRLMAQQHNALGVLQRHLDTWPQLRPNSRSPAAC
jgi:low temperature requirement protein LtrA